METVGDSDSGVEDWVEARDTLRRWREEGSRRSRRTCEVGRFLFNYRKWNLEDEGKGVSVMVSQARLWAIGGGGSQQFYATGLYDDCLSQSINAVCTDSCI